MPGFDITVPTSWHVVAVHDPYGTKFMSNTALQDPCAVAADGADWPGSADPAEPGPIRWVRISASQGTQWVFTVFCQVQRPMM
jgi:hypothetical protein